jgi:hypothetical protein
MASLAVALVLFPPPAAADCTCRALGRDFVLGHAICLATPDGPRRAVCGMVLNNTSWHVSGTPCVLAAGEPARVTELAPERLPRPASFEAWRTQGMRQAPQSFEAWRTQGVRQAPQDDGEDPTRSP